MFARSSSDCWKTPDFRPSLAVMPHAIALGKRRTIVDKLPPHVQARADELLACAPPLTDEAKLVIVALGQYARRATESAVAEPRG